MRTLGKVCGGALLFVMACGSDEETAGGPAAPGGDIVYRSSVQPITTVEGTKPGVFIQPFLDCRPPVAGDTATRPDGKVCTNVAISACTEPGKYFPDYASCEVVRRQRPYWAAPPAKVPPTSDPRLSDARYMSELEWVTEQIAASGCTCCHDNRVIAASQWDIAAGPLWIDTLSDPGLALFAGLADSVVLGAYPPAENHGFDRNVVGIPTTDNARMQAFMIAELKRRGLTEEWARSVPPFGGPIYTAAVKPPSVCGPGQGIDVDGSVRWTGGAARYVYVLKAGTKNPGVPPNLDLPEGTLWRLDVSPARDGVQTGIRFGQTPPGTWQSFPESTPAKALEKGTTYQLFVLMDVGVPMTNCLFEYGKLVPAAPSTPTPTTPDASLGYGDAAAGYSDAGAGDASAESDGSTGPAMCTLAGGDAKGFGAPCSDTANHSDCSCEADYCSKSPFDAQGYCSKIDCLSDPSVCPAGWRCADLSAFPAGIPSVCTKP